MVCVECEDDIDGRCCVATVGECFVVVTWDKIGVRMMRSKITSALPNFIQLCLHTVSRANMKCDVSQRTAERCLSALTCRKPLG